MLVFAQLSGLLELMLMLPPLAGVPEGVITNSGGGLVIGSPARNSMHALVHCQGPTLDIVRNSPTIHVIRAARASDARTCSKRFVTMQRRVITEC